MYNGAYDKGGENMAMSDQVIHNFDFNKLIEFASTAKGDVYLKTPEGDILNLKSRLTQLLALSRR